MYWHLGMTILGDPTIVPAPYSLGVDGPPQTIPAPSVHPNPSPGNVAINGNGAISVYDLTGRLVAHGENSLNVSGLQSGLYLVRVHLNGASSTGRFTVVR
jgi:hypothetical protein